VLAHKYGLHGDVIIFGYSGLIANSYLDYKHYIILLYISIILYVGMYSNVRVYGVYMEDSQELSL